MEAVEEENRRVVRDRKASQVFARQYGVITRAQAVAAISTGSFPDTEDFVFRRRRDLAGKIKFQRGFHVTDVHTTLRDISRGLTDEAVESALWAAFDRRHTTPDALEAYLKEARGGSPGVARLRRVLSRGTVPARSILEWRMHRLMRRARLPDAISAFKVFDADRQIAEIDFAYPAVKLAIEVDGLRFHRDWGPFNRDRLRSNDLVLLGWRPLHFTWQMIVRQPGYVGASTRAALAPGAQRGLFDSATSAPSPAGFP